MTEIIKKFRVLEDGKYRIAVKVSGGSRLSEILLGDAQIDFGFVRSISGGALFLSDIITASRGKEIFFKILSDSATFVASEFRTFFRAIDTNIKFQDIVAEEYKEVDPGGGGGGGEEPPEPPEPPEVDYGPDLTPSSWYPYYTKHNFTGNTLEIPISDAGVYQMAICLAEPYFIESVTMTGGNQFNPTAGQVTNITNLVRNPTRYYYNSTDSIRDELVLDYVNKITVRINTSDPEAPLRGSAVMIRYKRELDVYTEYINRLVTGDFTSKHYIGADGASIAEGIEVPIWNDRTCRLVAFRVDDDIKAETSIPDTNTLMVVRHGSYSAGTPYKFNAAGTSMWPAKGTVNILARKMGSDENMYFRWISRELIAGKDQSPNYNSCTVYRTGSVAKYYIDSSTGKAWTQEITNPATGKTESVKLPNGLTTTAYGYAKIIPAGRIFACRRVKISSCYDITDELQAWRNNPPVNILDLASEDMKKSTSVAIVVEMVQSANSKNYDAATGTFRIHSSGRQGRLYISSMAAGEDGIDYASIGTVKDYQYYINNRLVKTADGKKYMDIWEQVDYSSHHHRLFFNVTTANTDGSVQGLAINNPWFVLDNDPSRVYQIIRMSDIFRHGSYNPDAAKRLIAYPSPGMDIYISILDTKQALTLSSSSSDILTLPVSPS